MAQLNLVSVLWKDGDENGKDAVASVEDGVVVYLKFPDGYEVRLLMHELEALFDFAVAEVLKQEGEVGEEITNFKDGVPF